MDGVPGVTQRPVGRGESFEYRFRAEPAGTYFFHSHAGLQLDRGLLGPLVVEEAAPHVDFDREYVVVLDDYLPSEPRPPSESSAGPRITTDGGPMGNGRTSGGPMGNGRTSGGPMGNGRTSGGPMGSGRMGGMMNLYRPPYRGHLVNGRLRETPPTFDVSEGERVRFRFVNASSATMYQVGLGGHELEVSHADGRPVQPVTVDSFSFGPGERYDAIVTADNPGAWGLVARAVSGSEPPAVGRLQYDGSDDQSPRPPSGGGRHLQYGDLTAVEPLDGVDGSPDRTFDLTLTPGGDGYAWTIDGQTYPDADPLRVSAGEHVRVNMVNRSPVRHPMHLHGHFFQVGDAVKDTVVVPGHMGQVRFDFRADNPGDWLFHCHNLYHLEAGMARLLTYG
jgi:FtsP/CotA-like multicopper oxidase with cupredoxin domain